MVVRDSRRLLLTASVMSLSYSAAAGIAVRPGPGVCVAVVGACDQRDPLVRSCGCGGDRGPRRHVIGGGKVPGRRDDHQRRRRIVPAAHEPQRYEHAPVHRGHRGPGLVGAEADTGGGESGGAERLEHAPCQLGVAADVELDRGRDAVEPARDAARHDDAEGIRDVDVVRRGDDDRFRPRGGESPPELLHARACLERDVALLRRACLRDGDPAVRSDRGKHQRHYLPTSRGGSAGSRSDPGRVGRTPSSTTDT